MLTEAQQSEAPGLPDSGVQNARQPPGAAKSKRFFSPFDRGFVLHQAAARSFAAQIRSVLKEEERRTPPAEAARYRPIFPRVRLPLLTRRPDRRVSLASLRRSRKPQSLPKVPPSPSRLNFLLRSRDRGGSIPEEGFFFLTRERGG